MPTSDRPIFRASAIKQYMQGRDKDVLPRYVSPPVFIFLWIILGLCLVAGCITWATRIPIYASGVGEIIDQDNQYGYIGSEASAVVFLPPNLLSVVRSGQLVQLQIGSNGPQLHLKIAAVASKVLSPDQARKKYNLDGALALLVTQPSVVVVVRLEHYASDQDLGTILHARVEIGSQRVLSLVPIVGVPIGG